MRDNNFKFNIGDTVMVQKDYGKMSIGTISGISIYKNKIEYSIKGRCEKYPESRLLAIR